MQKKEKKLLIALIVLIIAVIIGLLLILAITMRNVLKPTNILSENEVSNSTNTEGANNKSNKASSGNSTSSISSKGFIKLTVKGQEKITDAELLNVNDYQLSIKEKLLDKGYAYEIEDDVLTITADDNTYKCIAIQLSSNYEKPTEKEVSAFEETQEYKSAQAILEKDGYTKEYEKSYDKAYTEYFKKLGYNEQNSPNYTLTNEELTEKIGEYLKEGEAKNSGINDVFPGDKYYKNYDWGKTTLYAIPKSEKKGTQEFTSEYAICLYLIEYYDDVQNEGLVDLWTL